MNLKYWTMEYSNLEVSLLFNPFFKNENWDEDSEIGSKWTLILSCNHTIEITHASSYLNDDNMNKIKRIRGEKEVRGA